MEHGLYLKLEKIVDKLANEKGCMLKDPEHYTGKIKESVFPEEIPFGENKGKLEYYDRLKSITYRDFLKKCFAILPRDDLSKIPDTLPKSTGVTMDTLLSDKICSENERIKQKLTINKFFQISEAAGLIRFCLSISRSKNK